jgi:hypothetical protein
LRWGILTQPFRLKSRGSPLPSWATAANVESFSRHRLIRPGLACAGSRPPGPMRPRRREESRTNQAATSRSSQYRRLVNPFEPVRIFSEDEIESLHLAALGVLERQGMRVLSDWGRKVLAAEGANVDEASQMVRLDPGLVAHALTSVPAEVNLVARNPVNSCTVGGRNVVFAPVVGPPAVSDCARGKRTGSIADFRDFVRLSQSFDVIHMLGQRASGRARRCAAPRDHAGTAYAFGTRYPIFSVAGMHSWAIASRCSVSVTGSTPRHCSSSRVASVCATQTPRFSSICR